VDLVVELHRADVEADLDIGLGLPLVDGRGVRILERQVLHILRDDADRGAHVFAVGLLIDRAFRACFFGHFRCFRIGEGKARGAATARR
jgi:hypothetical protein